VEQLILPCCEPAPAPKPTRRERLQARLIRASLDARAAYEKARRLHHGQRAAWLTLRDARLAELRGWAP
jgi:hypothetical protein